MKSKKHTNKLLKHLSFNIVSVRDSKPDKEVVFQLVVMRLITGKIIDVGQKSFAVCCVSPKIVSTEVL